MLDQDIGFQNYGRFTLAENRNQLAETQTQGPWPKPEPFHVRYKTVSATMLVWNSLQHQLGRFFALYFD